MAGRVRLHDILSAARLRPGAGVGESDLLRSAAGLSDAGDSYNYSSEAGCRPLRLMLFRFPGVIWHSAVQMDLPCLSAARRA